MNVRKLAAAVAAAAITLGVAAANTAPATAADNIKTFGEQERLNGPNSQPYIGYTVFNLDPSSAPVPHNGKLYSARLVIDGFGGNTDPQINRFGARSQSGIFYPAIPGASDGNMLYFDVTGPIPNSVVWNDGVRDILCWIPGELPLEPSSVMEPPAAAAESAPAPATPYDPFAPGGAAYTPAPAPAEASGNLGEATPDVIAPSPFELTEGEVASPGFRG